MISHFYYFTPKLPIFLLIFLSILFKGQRLKVKSQKLKVKRQKAKGKRQKAKLKT